MLMISDNYLINQPNNETNNWNDELFFVQSDSASVSIPTLIRGGTIMGINRNYFIYFLLDIIIFINF